MLNNAVDEEGRAAKEEGPVQMPAGLLNLASGGKGEPVGKLCG